MNRHFCSPKLAAADGATAGLPLLMPGVLCAGALRMIFALKTTFENQGTIEAYQKYP